MRTLNVHTGRRHFIKTLTATGTLCGASASSQLRPHALNEFRTQLKGELILPADARYEAARRVYFWNPTTEKQPALIARCANVDDVLHAMEFARKHDMEIAVRGGGHSAMGWGTSNGLVIDLTGMKRMTIDPVKRTARIDAGVLGGEVMRSAGQHGLAPVVGQCPGVGAAGLTLGGGLGWLSGLHGAACDNLLSARVVTADGRILSVDAVRNPELLWGLRGAGANFGVTTSLDCRLYSIAPVTSGDIYYPAQQARPVLRFFRDFMAEAPDSFQATLNLTPGERGVFVNLCHAGEGGEAERLLQRFRTAGTPSRDTVQRQEFAQLASRVPAGAANVSFRYVATVYRDQLSDHVVNAILDRLSAAPREAVIGISHYMHGQVCRVAPDATAFPLRQSGGVHVRIGMDWNDAAKAPALIRWADEARRLLQPSTGERIYANYQSHAGNGSASAVFGSNLGKLIALKTKCDPTNLFRRNSNIEPMQA